MNTFDRVVRLHARLGLKTPSPAVRKHGVAKYVSEAGLYLEQIEKHLDLEPTLGYKFGNRLDRAEAVASSARPFVPGERVVYIGTLVPRYAGKTGVLIAPRGSRGWMMRLDGETLPRYFETCNLKLEPIDMTILNSVLNALRPFSLAGTPSSVDQAASELLAATKIASEGDRLKKRAKDALQRLGIILPEYRPGTVVAFDGTRFRIEAQTKEPSERLDEPTLKAELNILGLSRAAIDRAFTNARVANKPATSIVVTEK